MAEYSKPLPVLDEASTPYWKACREGRLVLQKCRSCGTYQNFPRIVCSKCLSEALEWVKASGRGVVYSFTIIYRPPIPEFRDDVPYTVAVVELEEGIRMMTNIVEYPPEEVKIGMEVEVVFDNVTDEIALPKFRPVKA